MTYSHIVRRYAFREDDEHFLNKGSFGSVYQGMDRQIKQKVAIKVRIVLLSWFFQCDELGCLLFESELKLQY